MYDNIKELISKEEIEKRLKILGEQITKDYIDKEITIVVTLKGAFMTASTLVQSIKGNIEILFTRVSSYGNEKESRGHVVMVNDIDQDLSNKNILIIEDIVDTGYTLNFLKEEYLKRRAFSVKICSLLDKPSRRKANIKVDYVGFTIDNKFVVGYGLDNQEKCRELPYVGYIE